MNALWIVDPSQRTPEHEGVAAVGAGWPGAVRVFRPALVAADGPGPDDGYACRAVVVMGSAASPLDTDPWLLRLSDWLRPIVTGTIDKPALGICFGHQLFAHCAGGEVGLVQPDGEKRKGVEESTLSGCRLLPDVRSLRVVVSHREEVKRAPPHYRVVARRGSVTIDGLEHCTHPVFSFQFHPEAGDEFAGHVGIDSGELDARQRGDSRRLLSAFRDLVVAAPADG